MSVKFSVHPALTDELGLHIDEKKGAIIPPAGTEAALLAVS
jgi:hypothetical protein